MVACLSRPHMRQVSTGAFRLDVGIGCFFKSPDVEFTSFVLLQQWNRASKKSYKTQWQRLFDVAGLAERAGRVCPL